MSDPDHSLTPAWSVAAPAAATLVTFAATMLPGGFAVALQAAALIACVLAAVHHAEVIAHRLGEPFGTLVLALAVTIIEVALVVSMMVSGGTGADTLARDTVYSAIMIVCNGVVGLCLMVGGWRHHVLHFRVDGTSPALSVLAALASLTLVLPTFTTTTPGPTFSTSQLVFAGIMALLLYAAFVFVQTVRHRDYFLPVGGDDESPAPPPSVRATLASSLLLPWCLVLVVVLAKSLSPSIRAAVAAAGAPVGVVGIAIALLVLLPETWAAVRAAARNRMQVSLNLALGSALATIGLTIPAVVAVSMWIDLPLTLGLPAKEMVLFTLTMGISILTLGSGRATVLQGAVHLVLFAVFLFLAVVP